MFGESNGISSSFWTCSSLEQSGAGQPRGPDGGNDFGAATGDDGSGAPLMAKPGNTEKGGFSN
jgi:hypothetical protein